MNAQVKSSPSQLQYTSGSTGFLENKGQITDQDGRVNTEVKYLLPLGNGLNVQLRSSGFSYDSYSEKIVKNEIKNDTLPQRAPKPLEFHRIDIDFPGSNKQPQVIAENPSYNYRIYFNKKNGEQINANHFERIRYNNLYKNIDLIVEKTNKRSGFEYYFVVHPGGDYNQIRIQYKGAITRLVRNRICLSVRQGEIKENIPSSYLLSDHNRNSFIRNAGDKEISVRYTQIGKNLFGFVVPVYDHAKKLVIDPTPDLVWGTYLGGSLNDWAETITCDNEGNVIVGGATHSSNNIATAGAYQTTLDGFQDAFLAKYQGNGNLLWMTYFGGESTDNILSVTTGSDNDIYIAGITDSENVISTPGTHQVVKNFGTDSFIEKFSPTGMRIWGTYYGGDDVEFIHSIKVDQSNRVYIAGWTHSTVGIATPGSFQPAYAGGILNDAGDAFLARLSATGTRDWGTYYGGITFDRFYGMDIDINSGMIYAAGITYSTSGISSPGAFQPNHAGGTMDGWVVKFDVEGNRKWATYFGGPEGDYAMSLAIDNNQRINITGITYSSSGISTPGAQQTTFGSGGSDAFVAQFNATGSREWGTYLGGNGEDMCNSIACDNNNNIYVTGLSFSTNNVTTPNSYQPTVPPSTTGAIMVKYNSTGLRQWGTYYGHSGPYPSGEGRAAATDNNGNAYFAGSTTFTDNVATCNATQPVWGGHGDAFVAHFSESATPSSSVTISANPVGPYCPGSAIVFNALPMNAGTGVSFQWKINNSNAGTNSATFTHSNFNNGDIVSCVVTTSPSPCNPTGIPITSNSITIQVTSPAVPSVSISASGLKICQGSPVTFTAIANNAGSGPVYQWKVNNINSGTNSPAFTTSTLNDGDVVSCVLTSSLSCLTINNVTSNLISIQVVSITTPTISISASDNNICAGAPITFIATALPITATASYQWSVNGVLAGINSNSLTRDDLVNGDLVECVLSATFPDCPAVNITSNQLHMIIRPVPLVTITPPNPDIFFGDSIQLFAVVTGNVASYTWSPSNSIAIPSTLSPFVKPHQSTLYTINIEDMNGCSGSANVEVTVFQDIFMPSAFTPNSDGKNDIFRIPPGASIDLEEFSIYNRYGNKVFTTKNAGEGWDGKYLGAASPVGVYVYTLRGITSKGKIELKGIVTIIR